MPDRIEVAMKRDQPDPAGEALRERLREDLHVTTGPIRVIDVYTIHADLSPAEVDRVRLELLTDPVIQESSVNTSIASGYDCLVEVGFRPGVTDNVGKSAKEGMQDTLSRALPESAGVFKSTQYALSGVSIETARAIARDALANDLIQQWVAKSAEEMREQQGKSLLGLPIVTEQSDPVVHTVDLEIADEALQQLSRNMMLALELAEMKAIQGHYRDKSVVEQRKLAGLPPLPTDIELEVIAQTWSEHCKHKIFAARIEYTDERGEVREIDGLFKTYIKATTDEVAKRVDWLVSVFHDNAGIIRFDDDNLFALKVETHNSPSALDPYGGAMTGIVGVNRDILGAGMGCRCIFNTDVFCFASPYFEGEIPARLFHPRRVLRGVHAGVRDGGNQSGIPTINGAIVFHEHFLGKPLVFCGTGGMIPRTVAGRPSHEKAAAPGDHIVMVGGRIGKDGIHGATFSSEELHEGSPATAVQIGDPITQKKMSDFLLEARDAGLFSCITDNGAGGLSSSIGEMAKDAGGAEIHLDRAPLKYAGLAPWEIFLSEAQERMSVAVPEARLAAFLDLARRRSVEATVLGAFTASGYLECFHDGRRIAQLSMEFLHDGVPRMHLRAQLAPAAPARNVAIEERDYMGALKAVLGSLNVCSKETFVRMYDHEVQGQSVLKPFQGVEHDGPGDAGVIRPLPDSKRGIAVSCGICPKFSELDAYDMMACAVDEAVRNLVCVGARLGQIAGLDNFCWPDPVESEKTPDGAHKLAQLVRCCEALYDTCLAYDIPLISGKDSMKNDYKIGETKISIPPTVLFTAAAILDDVNRVVSMDAKAPGDLVYVVGETRDELGGSEYFAVRGQNGGAVPRVCVEETRLLYGKLSDAIAAGLLASCHDCSDGGLATALAESAFSGGCGMDLDLGGIPNPSPVSVLFSESAGRFVATVTPDRQAAFEQAMQGAPVYLAGRTTGNDGFSICFNGELLIHAPLASLKEAWQRPLHL